MQREILKSILKNETMTTAQVCKFLDVSRQNLKRLRDEKRLTYVCEERKLYSTEEVKERELLLRGKYNKKQTNHLQK